MGIALALAIMNVAGAFGNFGVALCLMSRGSKILVFTIFLVRHRVYSELVKRIGL
jgi:hypothetical protein